MKKYMPTIQTHTNVVRLEPHIATNLILHPATPTPFIALRESKIMGEQWDLTSSVSPYLDRHMMFPLLEFMDNLIASKQIGYEADHVQAARLALLRPTKMIDYALDILNGDGAAAVASNDSSDRIKQELQEEKTRVLQQLEVLKEGCSKLQDICGNEEELVRTILADVKCPGIIGM